MGDHPAHRADPTINRPSLERQQESRPSSPPCFSIQCSSMKPTSIKLSSSWRNTDDEIADAFKISAAEHMNIEESQLLTVNFDELNFGMLHTLFTEHARAGKNAFDSAVEIIANNDFFKQTDFTADVKGAKALRLRYNNKFGRNNYNSLKKRWRELADPTSEILSFCAPSVLMQCPGKCLSIQFCLTFFS